MSVLAKDEIIKRLKEGKLLTNARKNLDGTFDVETASYDLTAGILIWKENINVGIDEAIVKTLRYDSELSIQYSRTLQPGQMMFVITHEEILMPKDLCGTVYSRNKLSRDGILALNAGHVDPGFEGPIAIRLINLRAIPYTLRLGVPIYTIVFHTLVSDPTIELKGHRPISIQETIEKYTESANSALSNALYDLSITHDFVRKSEWGQVHEFVKKEEFGKVFGNG